MGQCPHCGGKVPYLEILPPTRNDSCSHCQRDLRCCLSCKFYDKNSYNECKEPSAERIVDKQKANFCDWFKFSPTTNSEDQRLKLLAKAQALFKK